MKLSSLSITFILLSSVVGPQAEARLTNQEKAAVMQRLRAGDYTVLDQLSLEEDREAFQKPSAADNSISIPSRWLDGTANPVEDRRDLERRQRRFERDVQNFCKARPQAMICNL